MQKRGDRLPFTAALLSTLVAFALFGLGSGMWLLWLFGGQGVRTWQEMAWWGPLVVLATGVSQVSCLGALVLRGWKPRLPAAVFLTFGLMPWLVGTLGTFWGARMCFEAVANVNPSDKAIILVNGLSEALASSLFGGGLSVALLLSLAVGLGTAALAVASGRRASEGPAFEPGGPASAALLCLAAALAVGTFLPSASLLRDAFGAIANVNPVDRETLLTHAAASLGPARVVSWVVRGAALALVVGTALWARRRLGTGLGRAVAAGLCVVPAFAVQGLTSQRMEHIARVTATKPWASVEDFQPASLQGAFAYRVAPQVLVTRTHLKRIGEKPGPDVPLEGALAEALRESLSEWQLEAGELAAADLHEPVFRPELFLAVDGRLDGAKLRVLVEAAREAGVRSLILVGEAPPTPQRALLAPHPLLAPFTQEVRATAHVALASALPRDYAEYEPGGWRARVEGHRLALTPLPHSTEEPLTLDLDQPPPEGEPVDEGKRVLPVYLSLGEELTAERLMQVSAALSTRSTNRRLLLPVLLTAPPP